MKRIFPLVLLLFFVGCTYLANHSDEPDAVPVSNDAPNIMHSFGDEVVLSPRSQASLLPQIVHNCNPIDPNSITASADGTSSTSFPPTIMKEVVELESSQVDKPSPFFVGNSLMVGLESRCTEGYTFQSKTGISLSALNNQLKLPDNYTMAVIEMGTNELGVYSKEQFKSDYATLIEKLDCLCYCLSIPPVNESKSNYADRVNNNNVKLYNSYIIEICEETGSIYVDCSEFFGDILCAGWTHDGLHMSGQTYENWYRWVLEKVGLR